MTQVFILLAFSTSETCQFYWSHDYVILNVDDVAISESCVFSTGYAYFSWIDVLLKWKLLDAEWQLNRFGCGDFLLNQAEY